MDLLKKPWVQASCISAVVFIVYAITRQADNPYNQYVLLTDAFLHGRLHVIDPPPFLELARFGNDAFVIDPPAPTVFLLPFVAIFGTGADHVLVSCGVGAVAVGLIYIAALRLWTNVRFAIAMAALVALGTNFWWLASDGGFWSFAHTSAVFFLAAALVEAAGRKRPWLVALLVGLAGLSRLPVFLIAPMFLYMVLDSDLRLRRANVEKAFLFGVFLAACAVGYLAYNYARYGSLSDLGYYHPQYLHEPWFAKGRFDITYIPRHLRAIFTDLPEVRDRFPYLFPKSFGVALILTTPSILYAIRARLTGRNIAAIVSIALVAIPLLTHGVTGWSQFGYRYSMDVLPALLMLIASGMRERVTKPALAVIAFSVLANFWGVLAFNMFDWVA